jgi:undecaprenyl-diphosphatase
MPAMSTQTKHAEQDSSPRSRGAVRSGVTLVVAWAVILGLVVGFGWLITHALKGAVNPWDNEISRWFADQRTGALNEPADVGTLLGETVTGVSVAVLAALGFSLWRRSWRPALFVVLLEAGIGGFYLIATHVDTRQRPPVKILDAGLVPDHSFPSGHVATAVVAYGGILVLTWVYARSAARWVAVLGLLPLFVMLARLYQGAHHLTDVLTSVVYASVWMLVVARTVLLPDRDR